MDVTLVIALAAATLSVVLFGVMVFLLAGLGAVVWKSRDETGAAAPQQALPTPGPAAPPGPARAFDSLDPSVEGNLAPLTRDPPGPNLIGFFDDETHSAPGLELRTELFQQSQVPASAFNSVPPGRFVEEDEENDGEATEIFSASQLGSEFAEFMEEGEDATARLQKERGVT